MKCFICDKEVSLTVAAETDGLCFICKGASNGNTTIKGKKTKI